MQFSRLEDEFYRGGITWQPKNTSSFWGHSMDEILQKRLGTKLPEDQDKRVRNYFGTSEFSVHFGQCIKSVENKAILMVSLKTG